MRIEPHICNALTILLFSSFVACEPTSVELADAPAVENGPVEVERPTSLRPKPVATAKMQPAAAPSDEQREGISPRQALAINDPIVTHYGLRARVTNHFIDRGLRSAAKLLGTWTAPQSVKNSNFYSEPDGFNFLLDPGYDTNSKAAGMLRTTPMQLMWAWRDDCGTADGNAGCKIGQPRAFQYIANRKPGAPGTPCNNNDIIPLQAGFWCNDEQGNSVSNGVACNQRGFPGFLQAGQREHGFYATQNDQCYYAMVLCTYNTSGYCAPDSCTHPQANELGSQCELAPLDAADLQDGYAAVGAYIAPNGMVENAGGDTADASWMRPPALRHDGPAGDYYGYVPTRRFGLYTGAVNNPHGYDVVGNDGTYNWRAGAFPANAADYNELNEYHEYSGSYFRLGDDIAFYPDVQSMQIHSVNRDGVSDNIAPNAVAGCGEGPIYTGQLDSNGDPIYFWDRTPQCLRPKAYWDPAKYNESLKEYGMWVACDPYDSYLEDGTTLNPNRDDNEVIYPGDNAAAVCGTQVAGSPLIPFDSGGNSTGWSGLYLSTFQINDDNAVAADRNTIDFVVSGDEWRLELNLYLDMSTECYAGQYGGCGGRPGYQFKRKWAMSTFMVDNISLAGKVAVLSIDDHSCSDTQGHCSYPWSPNTDGLLRPDRFQIGLDMDINDVTVQLHPGTNQFRAIYSDLSQGGNSCLANHSYVGCLIRLGTGGGQSDPVFQLLGAEFQPVFEEEFFNIINGTITDLNDGLPNLGAIFSDPWDFGNAFVDVGLFIAGSDADAMADPNDTTRNIWRSQFLTGPAGTGKVLSVNGAIGFRPIAFKPPNGNGVMLIDDPADGYDADSFFAKPTMIYPDTSSCQVNLSGGSYSPVWSQTGTSYTYNAGNGQITGVSATSGRLAMVFFDTSTDEWSLILGGYTDNNSGVPRHYLVEKNRSASFNGGSWGVNDGWITPSFTGGGSGSISDFRIGDLFWHASTPNVQYRIIGIDTGNGRIRLDFAGAQQHKTTPMLTGAAWESVSRRCSRDQTLYNAEASERDYGDYVEEGTFTDSKTGLSHNTYDIIEPYFVEPYDTVPSWCVTPTISKAESDKFPSLYPMNTWLAFNTSIDSRPAGASGLAMPTQRVTLGAWESIPGTATYGGRGIVEADQNDYRQKESVDIDYDGSIHVHQRILNQFAQVLFASGAGCLEFGQTDRNTGDETLWAGFFNTDSFAAFIPEVQTMYPGAEVKLRIAPQQAPHIRTGVGDVTYTPVQAGSAPIVSEPYTLAAALPDMQVSVVVVDPTDGQDITVFKMNWNTVVGLYLRAMRQCNVSDPAYGTDDCSTDPALRTISGYWQAFVEMGNDDLALEFEPPKNSIDGFSAGRFTQHEMVCEEAGCDPVVNSGEAKFEVVEAYCGDNCDMLGFAQSIVTLLDATLSMYFDTRASTGFLTEPAAETLEESRLFDMDFLYVGPDGPNDDGIGTSNAGSRGDYLAFYFKQFGDLELMSIVDMLGGMAPPIKTQAVVPALQAASYVSTNSPTFEAGVQNAPGEAVKPGLYTYRLDNGFWKTPRSQEELSFRSLTEGRHVLEIKALEDNGKGLVAQVTPTRMEFFVDSVAPDVRIPASDRGVFGSRAKVVATDLQTPSDELFVEYSLDDGEWEVLSGDAVSLRGLADGRHTLRVRATDLAGNTASAARILVLRNGSGCGGCASGGDGSLALVLIGLFMLAVRRTVRDRLN